MKTYRSIDRLLEEALSLQWNGAVFVNRNDWTVNPLGTPLLLLAGDDELEDLADVESHLPRLAAERGMKQLLDVQTLQGVVEFEKRRNANAATEDFVNAINYYLEMDAFFDPNTAT